MTAAATLAAPAPRTSNRPPDPAHAADLRRRRGRDLSDLLLTRAAHLPAADRTLIQAIYADSVPAKDVAKLQSRSPRAVRRRARALVQRMLSPRFEFVLRHRDQWTPTRRRIATACILEGRTMRDAAASLRVSLHMVRRHMDAITALAEADAQ